MAKKVLSLVKKTICGMLIALFVFVAVVASWMAIDKYIRRSPVPTFAGYALLTIETGSMSGTIEIGDMVLMKDTGDYRIGDIITFLPEGDTIPTTHRIIQYGEDGTFITKGDANNTRDTAPVPPDIILGEVVEVLPRAGLFVDWVRAEGWLYLVAALVILGVGTLVVKYIGDDREADETCPAETDAEDDDTAKKNEEPTDDTVADKNDETRMQHKSSV